MEVLQTIRNFLVWESAEPEPEAAASESATYDIRPLTVEHLHEVLRLNIRCFRNGENYTKHTFAFLLNEPNTLSYRAVTDSGRIAGFVFVMVNDAGAGHLTTIAVAPEHRRRGLGERMLAHVEDVLRLRSVNTVILEVRVGNTSAQALYQKNGYSTVQRIENYYVNGEACYLMMKPLG
jgi:ribosomal-protein-alanine N-acetyltransferase